MLAMLEAIIYYQAYQVFTESMRTNHPAALEEWEHQIQQWEKDNTQFCPYDLLEGRKFDAIVYCEVLTRCS
jgi:hypothetical protein